MKIIVILCFFLTKLITVIVVVKNWMCKANSVCDYGAIDVPECQILHANDAITTFFLYVHNGIFSVTINTFT